MGRRKNYAFLDLMERFGFDQIEIQTSKAWWKALNESGRHVLIQSTGERPHLPPDWKSRCGAISVYRGPQLQENLEHTETAYIIEDLVLFLEDIQTGSFS